MIKLPISKLFSLIFLLILIKTNALGNNFLFDKNGKLFIETSNSGFIFHKNFMSQNKHNFDYIRTIQNHEVVIIIKNLNLEMVIVLVMKIGVTAIMIDKGLSLLQSQINQYLVNNVMVTV